MAQFIRFNKWYFCLYLFCRYGEEAGKAAGEGLDAAGHAIGTAWTVFKIRKAMNPKSAFKSTTLAKSAAKAKADEVRAKKK